MRLLLCAALLLLAGCTGPSVPTTDAPGSQQAAPDAAATATPSPVVAVAYENVTYDVPASAWMTALALPSPTWEASAELPLPRPALTVFVELACVQTAGTAYGDPGFGAEVQVERPDGRTLISQYGGGIDQCRGGHAFPAKELGAGDLSFVAVSLSAPFAAVQVSYEVRMAVSLLSTPDVPAGYSALP